MTGRTGRFVAEAWRFAAVGLLATGVAFVLFNLLVHGYGLGWAPLNSRPVTGYVVANAIGMAVSFSGTKKWVFRARQARHADGGVTAFVLINVATMLIPMACLWVSRNLLDLDDPISDNVAANVVGLALAFVARFWLFRYGVFERVSDREQADPGPAGETPDVSGPGGGERRQSCRGLPD